MLARQADDAGCIRLARSALVDAKRAGDPRAVALALERIHLGLVGIGEFDDDDTGQRALAAYQELGDQNGMSRVLNNLGVEAYFDSRWSEASERYLEAVDAGRRSGNIVLTANAAMNSAEILGDQGSWDRSIALLDDAGRNYEAVGYAPGIAAVQLFSGVAAMRRGDLVDAERRLSTARTRLAEVGLDLLDEITTRELELDVLLGRATVERCQDVAAIVTDPSLLARVARCRSVVSIDSEGVAAVRHALLASIEGRPVSKFERALTLNALSVLVSSDPNAAAWRVEASEIFEAFGVVRTPPLRPSDLP